MSERIVRTALDPTLRGVPFSRSRLEKQQQRRFWLRVFCLSAFAAVTGVAAWKYHKSIKEMAASSERTIPTAVK